MNANVRSKETAPSGNYFNVANSASRAAIVRGYGSDQRGAPPYFL